MAQVCGKRLKYILKTALLCWKFLKNLTNGFSIWEMTKICGKQLKDLRNG